MKEPYEELLLRALRQIDRVSKAREELEKARLKLEGEQHMLDLVVEETKTVMREAEEA